MEKALKKTLSQYSGKIFLEKYLGLASLFSKSLKYNLGSCDIEKNRYIDIEKKISIISTISNYAN